MKDDVVRLSGIRAILLEFEDLPRLSSRLARFVLYEHRLHLHSVMLPQAKLARG